MNNRYSIPVLLIAGLIFNPYLNAEAEAHLFQVQCDRVAIRAVLVQEAGAAVTYTFKSAREVVSPNTRRSRRRLLRAGRRAKKSCRRAFRDKKTTAAGLLSPAGKRWQRWRVALDVMLPEGAPFNPRESEAAIPPELSGQDREIYAKGMHAWRTVRTTVGASCASCHAPDAFDLAFFDVTEEDIRRRGQGDGVAEVDIPALVQLVNLQRRRFGINTPHDRHSFRLLQPGGTVINPEGTRTHQDLGFAEQTVAEHFPELMSEELLSSPEQAHNLAIRLGTTPLRKLHIGVPLPLWMSDGFHGKEQFGTRDEWVPSLGGVPSDPEFFSISDTYVLNPTRENLYRLLEAAETMVTHQGEAPSGELTSAGQMEREKYFAMLIGQHLLRDLAAGIPHEQVVEPELAFREFYEFAFGEELSNETPLPIEQHRELGKSRSKVPFISSIWNVVDRARKPGGPRRDGKDNSTIGAELKELGVKQKSRRGRLYDLGYPLFQVNQAPTTSSGFFHQGQNQVEMMNTWAWLSGQVNEARLTGYANGSMETSHYPIHKVVRGMMNSAFSLRYGGSTNVSFARAVRVAGEDLHEEAHEATLKKVNLNSASFTILNTLYELQQGIRGNLKHAGNLKPSADHVQALLKAYYFLEENESDYAQRIALPAMWEIHSIVVSRAPGYFQYLEWLPESN